MASWFSLFSKKEIPIVEELVDSAGFVEDMNKPKTETNPLPEKRVSRSDLECSYKAVPVCFNGVNNTTQFISSSYKLMCLNPKTGVIDKKSQDNFDERLKKINMDRIIMTAVRHDCIFGLGYTEKRYNKGESKIVGFRVIDPKTFDYKKDDSGNIIINQKTQEPEGYEQDTGSAKIPVDKKYIIQHNMYEVGSCLQPLGLIEPAFKSILHKLHIEEAITESLYRLATPSLLVKVGTKEVPPRADSIKKVTEQFKKARHSSVYIYPYTQEVSTLQADIPDGINDILNYFTNEIITSMGVPKSFAYASSADLASKSVKALGANFTRKIEMIENSLSKEFEPVFAEMATLDGVEFPPVFVWDPIERDDLDAKAKRFFNYARSGLMSDELKNKLIQEITKMEGLKLE